MTLTIAVYGDSISTGTHGQGGWTPALSELGDVTVHNNAIGGSPLADVAPGSLVEVLSDPEALHPDADVVVLWHGSNDWYWGSPLDTSAGPRTFVGALTLCVSLLREVHPHVPIMVPTPLWRFEQPDRGDRAGDAWTTPNAVGCTLTDYRDALREHAARLALRIVDMDTSGISADTADELLEDRVHPNAAGYRRIAPLIVSAVREALHRGR